MENESLEKLITFEQQYHITFQLIEEIIEKQRENKYGLPMDWKKPARKEMITDLALNKNRIKLLKYIMWLSRQ